VPRLRAADLRWFQPCVLAVDGDHSLVTMPAVSWQKRKKWLKLDEVEATMGLS
jgi:hypothetical protein